MQFNDSAQTYHSSHGPPTCSQSLTRHGISSEIQIVEMNLVPRLSALVAGSAAVPGAHLEARCDSFASIRIQRSVSLLLVLKAPCLVTESQTHRVKQSIQIPVIGHLDRNPTAPQTNNLSKVATHSTVASAQATQLPRIGHNWPTADDRTNNFPNFSFKPHCNTNHSKPITFFIVSLEIHNPHPRKRK